MGPQTTPPLTAEEALAQRRRRAQNLLSVAGVVLVVLGLGWTAFFLMQDNRPVAGMELFLTLLGGGVVVLARRQHFRAAAGLLFGSLYLVLLAFSLWLDVPTEAAPRSSHLFLLSLGLCAYYVFQAEKPWLRYSVVALFFLTFLVFASTHIGFHTAYAIPDSVRVGGTWVNATCAVLVVVLTLYLMNTDQSARSSLHMAMRDALAARRFVLFYQPQVDAAGQVVGAEALLRWRDPERGLVSPGLFIPLAEQTGFILPLGQWALEAACEQLARWHTQPQTRHLTLSVNVSAQQVRQPDFIAQVRSALVRTGAPPHRLKLELTESMLVRDIEDLIRKMQTLDSEGVGFSLDDFGTGYSSLSYLKRLPLHQLKIDQSFVHDVMGDSNAAAITRTLISLGQSLGLTVIAEGVETEHQRDFLLRQGCRVFQGYLYSRPLEADAFEAYVAREGQPATGSIQAANDPAKMLSGLESSHQ